MNSVAQVKQPVSRHVRPNLHVCCEILGVLLFFIFFFFYSSSSSLLPFSSSSYSVCLLQGKQSLDSLPELLSCIAANNATLCWLLLHGMAGQQHSKQSTAVSKQSAAVAKQGVDEKAVIGLLLDTAALESWVTCCLLPLARQRSRLEKAWASMSLIYMQSPAACRHMYRAVKSSGANNKIRCAHESLQ